MIANANANPANTYNVAAAASLPTTDPIVGGTHSTVAMATANARALGLSANTAVDTTLTFSDSVTFEYNGVATPNAYDFMDVAAHELDEGLCIGSVLTGLANNAALPTNDYYPEDYFRYSAAPGTLDITTNPNADVYFSYDGGSSDVAQFNQAYAAGGASDLDRNDWIYGNFGCPAEAPGPYIQDAIGCPDEAVAVGQAGSPEVIVLQSLGYNPGSNPAAQTITFNPLSNVIFGVAPFSVSATATSGLTVSFASTTTLVCTVSSSTVTIVGVGTCSITASQSGNTNYAPAPSVPQSFTVTSPPPAPVLTSPANGATGVLQTASLTWNAAAGATSYDVYFGTSSPPSFLVNTTATTYSPGTLAGGTAYYWFIVARNTAGTTPSATWSFTTQGLAIAALQFYPISPCRLADTRGAATGFNGIAPFSGPSIPSGGTITFPVQSATEASTNTEPAPCGVIPSIAQAYSMNITVVPVAGGTVDYVSLWAVGSTQPFVSTLNDPQGLIVANAAIVPAGTPSGGISVYNAGPSAMDVVIDMNGYFAAPTSLQFYPVAPCRLVDTRGAATGFNGIAPFSGPSIPPAGTLTIPVQSATEASTNTTPAPCGVIPSIVQAYSINLTVVPHEGGAVDYVSLWPAGSTRPFVSTLNDPQGLIVANAAIVPAGASSSSGGLSVYNAGPSAADVVIDMNGYFAAPTALQFYPMAPCRLVDTRGAAAGFNGIAPFSGPSIPAGGTLTIPVQSTTEASTNTTPAPCGLIPSSAQAYSFNLTVVPKSGGAVDYVSLWPAGSTQPFVATLNDPQGAIVANAAIVPAGAPSGGVSVYNAGPSAADVIIDMNGYFAPLAGDLLQPNLRAAASSGPPPDGDASAAINGIWTNDAWLHQFHR